MGLIVMAALQVSQTRDALVRQSGCDWRISYVVSHISAIIALMIFNAVIWIGLRWARHTMEESPTLVGCCSLRFGSVMVYYPVLGKRAIC